MNNVSQGFTLLEIMVALFLIGVATSIVLFNAFSASESDRLKEHTQRLQVVFDMASDFAILNQQQLGLYIDEKNALYRFVLLDDEQEWQPIVDNPVFAEHNLPDPFRLELQLEDLPWQDPDSLFDNGIFDESLSVSEDGVEIGDEEDKKHPPPQVLILSSGDITPFSLLFKYEPDFGQDEPVYFRLNGTEVTPLKRLGPLTQAEAL
ncbi:type II secretion system minor pseudopilin GspH [Alteromonas flava]|uniref:type II secretion system minor pseudopilin GspH n=1 Tax=Alteromonas flava TaxID=2048003 RepID=UPI000C286551|nr:type II secretion system minor pseudopilin GspH [Alteromonas flava]